ncbi:uncharacterized protein [Primulina huaijiensis]|uniref:uncharacterized protein n=1 Tax=Primulina huaijiensis TaxID=1492673 RepID=UPI003CC73116
MDNATNNMVAADLLKVTKPQNFWTSCATHTINLMLEAIGKLLKFSGMLEKANTLTIFIYAHHRTLAIMRKYTKKSDIVRSGLDGGPIMVVTLQTCKKMAMRFLSLTSSLSECERNWSQFEGMHTKKRNKLETSRLNDLVYVKFNANLKKKSKRKMGGDLLLSSQAT